MNFILHSYRSITHNTGTESTGWSRYTYCGMYTCCTLFQRTIHSAGQMVWTDESILSAS